MSLVEKALQKLQATRPAPALRPSAPPRAPAASDPIPEPPAAAPVARDFDPRSRSGKVLRVDTDRLRALNMLPPATQEREIASQFRAIKRPLLRQLEVDPPQGETRHRHIMVTSALPGDGKTFTSLNLAMSLAMELDLTTLLVDADALKPHLTHTFGLDKEPGLLDVLMDPARRVEDVIVATEVPRLHLLPAGTRSETAAELLASARMAEVIAQLGTLYRRGIVVFDSPPVLLTTESRSLGAMLKQIVLVVRAGVTPQQAAKDAIGILGESARISLVLNGAELEGPVGYYYGYRYGYNAPPAVAPAPPATSE